MTGFVPKQGGAGNAMSGIEADCPPRREEVNKIPDYQSWRGHQSMTPVVNHSRENHSAREPPNEENKVKKE